MKPILLILCFFILFVCSHCKKDEVQETVQDVDQTTALKNVTFTFNGLTYQLTLPPGATGGKTFEELKKEDSAAFTNPRNYSITFTVTHHADNKKAEARDAKFGGMTVALVLDTIVSAPVNIIYGPFTVAKGTGMVVSGSGSATLESHKPVMLYMFTQIVAGADLVTTTTPTLNYKFGSVAGTLPLPATHQNIPTTADANTKAFLQGLLDSGVFN